MTERMKAAGAVPNEIHIHTRWGWVRPPLGDDFPYPRHGYNLRRSVLDPMLRRMAAETDGVELLLGHTVERPRFARCRSRGDGRARQAARAVQLLRLLPRPAARHRPRVADVDERAGRRLCVPERRRHHRAVRDAVARSAARVQGGHARELRACVRGPARGSGRRRRAADSADQGQGLDAERDTPRLGSGAGAGRRLGDGLRPALGRRPLVRAAGRGDAGRRRRTAPRQRAPPRCRAATLPPPSSSAARRPPPHDVRLLDRSPVQPDREADLPRGRARRPLRGPVRRLRRPLDRREPVPLPARACACGMGGRARIGR
jgi:hypothetical protein